MKSKTNLSSADIGCPSTTLKSDFRWLWRCDIRADI